MSLYDRLFKVTVNGITYNGPVTLCLNGCRISRDARICAHTNPEMDNRPRWLKLNNAKDMTNA